MKNYSTLFCFALFLLPCTLQSAEAPRDLTPQDYSETKEINSGNPKHALDIIYYEDATLPIETHACIQAPNPPFNVETDRYIIVSYIAPDGTSFPVPEDAQAITKYPKSGDGFLEFDVLK